MARPAVVGWSRPSINRCRWSGILGVAILLLGAGLLFGAAPPSTYTVNLAWDRSPSVEVTGYRIYYGIASGNYSNSVVTGNVASNSVAGLVGGVTYFLAVTAFDAAGVESPPSNEIRYAPGLATVQISLAANRRAVLTVRGLSGHIYEIQAAQTLATWTVIGTVTVGTSGSVSFTDTNAPNFRNRFYRTRDTQL